MGVRKASSTLKSPALEEGGELHSHPREHSGQGRSKHQGPEMACVHVSETERVRGDVTGVGAARGAGKHTYFAGTL